MLQGTTHEVKGQGHHLLIPLSNLLFEMESDVSGRAHAFTIDCLSSVYHQRCDQKNITQEHLWWHRPWWYPSNPCLSLLFTQAWWRYFFFDLGPLSENQNKEITATVCFEVCTQSSELSLEIMHGSDKLPSHSYDFGKQGDLVRGSGSYKRSRTSLGFKREGWLGLAGVDRHNLL